MTEAATRASALFCYECKAFLCDPCSSAIHAQRIARTHNVVPASVKAIRPHVPGAGASLRCTVPRAAAVFGAYAGGQRRVGTTVWLCAYPPFELRLLTVSLFLSLSLSVFIVVCAFFFHTQDVSQDAQQRLTEDRHHPAQTDRAGARFRRNGCATSFNSSRVDGTLRQRCRAA